MTSVNTTPEIGGFSVAKPKPIVITFDVKIGEKSYQSVFDRIMGHLARELEKESKPGYIFTKGEIILAFYDGHPGITPKMLKFVHRLRSNVQDELCVELPGWGVSALDKHIRGNVIHVQFQCWIVYEFYIFPINRWEDTRHNGGGDLWDC